MSNEKISCALCKELFKPEYIYTQTIWNSPIPLNTCDPCYHKLFPDGKYGKSPYKMYYGVFSGELSCTREGYSWIQKESCWDVPNKFSTFSEAVDYAKDWLGEYNTIPKDWDGSPLRAGCFGSYEIEIRYVLEAQQSTGASVPLGKES